MEIRVTVRDAESTYSLVQRLAEVVDTSAVVLVVDGPDVRAHARETSHAAVVDVLDAIEEWLDESEIAAVTVSLEGQEYTLARRARDSHESAA